MTPLNRYSGGGEGYTPKITGAGSGKSGTGGEGKIHCPSGGGGNHNGSQ